MSNRSSRSLRAAAATSAVLTLAGWSARAHAQACCAGSGAVTPGRLALHESALVGALAKASAITGHFRGDGHYVASPADAQELDFEEDLFGALRVADRGQVALLVPFVEAWRKSQGQAQTEGGVGDLNLSFRYDFTLAGESFVIPGMSALAGITFPTGKPPEEEGTTGTGAYQFNLGLAFEQTFGPWLLNATGVVAQRTARTVAFGPSSIHQRLAPQWTALAACAYTFATDVAVALSFSYAIEGNATIDGVEAGGTARRLATVTLSGVLPLNDIWRLQGGIFDDLPISQVGVGAPASAGLSITLVRSWI